MNFLFRYKKVFLGAGIILVAATLGYLIFFLFFYQEPPSQPHPDDPENGEDVIGLPEAEEGQRDPIDPDDEDGTFPGEDPDDEDLDEDELWDDRPTSTPLNETPSMGAGLTPDGDGIQYYNPEDGKFYRVDKDGNIVAISDKEFPDLEKVTWAPNRSKAVLEARDGSKALYDFETERQVTLPGHWEDFDFSPNSNELVMKSLGMDPDNRWLAVSDVEGGSVTPIEKIGRNDDQVYPNWSPNQQVVAMYTEGEDFDRQNVHFIGKHGESFRSITVEGRDFRPLWSTQGDRLLYSVHSSENSMNPQLWTTEASGQDIGANRQSLGLNTWSDKCAFSSNTEVYCGVPRDLPEGSGMFPEMAEETIDDLYKVNLETGEKEFIEVSGDGHNISDIQVSGDGNTIFFTDSQTGNVHKIDL